MDDLLIKTNSVKDAATSGPNGRDSASALAGLAGSFQDLLHRAGVRIGDGFSILAARTGLGSIGERADRVQPADDYGRQQSDEARDRFDDRGRDDNRADNSSDAPRAERDRDNDYGREHGSDHSDDRGGVRDTDYGESHADDHGDDSAARDDAPKNDDQDDGSQASSDDGDDGESAAKTSDSDDENKTAGDETDNQDGDVQSAGTDGVIAQTGVSTETTDKVLNGLLAGGVALSEEGVASGQGKVSSAEGQTTALEAISSASGIASEAKSENQSQTAVENTSKVTPVSTGESKGPQDNHQSQGAANAGDQAKTVANEQSAVFGDAVSGAAQTTLETQASGLAKAIGGGNQTQVSVTVSNEAQNLISKPSASLSANTVISGEGSSQSSNSQNTGTHTQGGGSQNQALQAQAAATQTQAAQNQSAQAAQAGADAKGLAQAQAASGNAGGTVHSGGGEGGALTGTGGVSGSQQTQSQSAVNQSTNTQNPTRTGRSMVEQVTVKITKAIQAGTDKITIQLRPANMGRVEVRMDISQDNRLSVLVIVDRPETLDQLQKDSRELQRALQEAGLQVDNGDLNFNLRGEENHAKEGDNSSGHVASVEDDMVLLDEEVIEQAVISSDGRVLSKGRIDVRA